MLTPLKPKTFSLLNPASKCPPYVSWGQFFQPVSIPRFTCIICAKFIPNRSDHISQAVEFLTPKPPQNAAWGIVGRIVFSLYVHSQMNPQTCTEFGANRSNRLTAFPDLDLWPLKTPRNAPCGIEGRILFSYVHSQTNPQTCTKFGDNRSSSLTASRDIWICDPLKPPQNAPWGIVGRLVFSICPFPDESADVNQSWCQLVQPFDSFSGLLNVCLEWQFVWHISIHRWICTCVPNLVPIGTAVWQLQHTFEFVTPQNAPWYIEGRIVFCLCPFPDESADVYQIWCQSVQLFDSLPRLLKLWPP